MSTYTPEIVPSAIMVSILNSDWDNKEGNVAKPKILEANTTPENPYELSLSFAPAQDAVVIVRPEPAGEREQLRDLGAQLKDTTFDLSIDLFTASGRQRLYDIKAEIRRIIHANMHSFQNDAGNGFQVIWFRQFQDYAQNTKGIWTGAIKLQCVSNKVAIDT